MLKLPLEVTPVTPSPLPADAWLLPGSDPDLWIDDIAGWGVPMVTVRLVVIGPPGDRCHGALCWVSGGGRPRAVGLALPYLRRCDRIFLPAASQLAPPVEDDELSTLLGPSPVVYVPGHGFLSFAEQAVLTVLDLFEPLESRTGGWLPLTAPRPLAARLARIAMEEPEDAETILGKGAEGIGEKPPGSILDGGAAGEAPEEGTAGGVPVTTMSDWIEKNMPRSIESAPSKQRTPPATPREPTWVDRLRAWAGGLMHQIGSPAMQAARDQAVDRLLKMFEKDPDRALRFALPLGTPPGKMRGTARGGAALDEQEPDFDLDRLSRPVAADFWGIAQGYHQRLETVYRKAANQAMALGRHRRAAYIFGELLGDHASAASALKQGGHHREAALLYREHLKSPALAAACLEEGGLLSEALDLYQELKNWLKVAELARRLDQEDVARVALRSAVTEFSSDGRLIEAARLLDDQLGAPDEALTLLESGWPFSPQAVRCLTEAFRLMGRLGLTPRALERLETFRTSVPAPASAVDMAAVASPVCRVYPDAGVRERAADVVRVVVGRRLDGAFDPEAQQLLSFLREHAPTDRLLARDGQRWFETRRTREQVRPAPAVPTEALEPELSTRFAAEGAARWCQATSTAEAVFVLGFLQTRSLWLKKVTWSGATDTLTWFESLPDPDETQLTVPRETLRPVVLWSPRCPRLKVTAFPLAEGEGVAARAGMPEWLPHDAVGLCYDEHDTLWVLRRTEGMGGLGLFAYSSRGEVRSSTPFPADLGKDGTWKPLAKQPGSQVAMASQDRSLFMAFSDHLVQMRRDGQCRAHRFTGPIRQLSLSPLFTRLRIGVAMQEGAEVLWTSPVAFDQVQRCRVAEDFQNPRVTFTRGGTLVVVTGGRGLVADLEWGKVKRTAHFALPGVEPVAALPSPRLDRFGIVTKDGRLLVYRVP